MAFELPELPYSRDALAPHISAETLDYHYGKHHKGYVKKLNKAVAGTDKENCSLEQIIDQSEGSLFNNAAQVWNHTFYWNSLSPEGGGDPSGELLSAIEKDFGSVDEFRNAFTNAATGRFGSGWAWLVQDSDGRLSVTSTSNAHNPLTSGNRPLLTCDVWEHAYYVDYRNARGEYLEAFWKLVNWEFAGQNLG